MQQKTISVNMSQHCYNFEGGSSKIYIFSR